MTEGAPPRSRPEPQGWTRHLSWLSTGSYAGLVWSLRWLALVGAAVTGLVTTAPGVGVWTVAGLYLTGQILLVFSYIRGWQRTRVALTLEVLDVVLPLLLVIGNGAWSSPYAWTLGLPAMTLSISLGPLPASVVAALLALAVTAVHQSSSLPGGGVGTGVLAAAAGVLISLAASQARSLAERMPAFGLRPGEDHVQDRRTGRDHRLSAGLTATLNFERLVELVLDTGAGVLRARPGTEILASVLFLRDDGALRIEAVRGLESELTGELWGVKEGPVGWALQSTEIVQWPLNEEPRLSAALNLSVQAGRGVCIPLVSDIRALGTIVYLWSGSGGLTPNQVLGLEAIAREAVIALHNAQLYRDLSREKEQLDEIQEEARRKLARDLHDGPTQTIAAIAMRTNFAKRQVDKDPQSAQIELDKVENMARRTTKEIRHLLFTLRPLILESQGLAAALVELADKARDTHGLKVLVEVEPGVSGMINPDKQGALFYIAEEAVNNARKHAAAENVWIRLYLADEEVVLEVEDDGVGFNVGAVDATYAQRGSLGMVTMRERAELVEGVFRLQSSEGDGTRIEIRVSAAQPATGGGGASGEEPMSPDDLPK